MWRGTTRSSSAAEGCGAGVVDRFGGVLQQVEHHLLDRDGVDHQRGQALRRRRRHSDLAAAQLDAGELDRVLDDRARPAPAGVAARFFHEGADAVDDLPGALGLAARSSPAPRSGLPRDLAALDARDHAVAVVGDRGERLVQFVRHRRGHLAHGDQAAGDLALLGLLRLIVLRPGGAR